MHSPSIVQEIQRVEDTELVVKLPENFSDDPLCSSPRDHISSGGSLDLNSIAVYRSENHDPFIYKINNHLREQQRKFTESL